MSSASDAIHESFVSSLRALGASVESMADLAAGEPNEKIRSVYRSLGRAQRELLFVRGVGFLNVHVRADPPGFWSVQKSVKAELDFLVEQVGVKCYYVFLVGRPSRKFSDGFIATDLSSPPFVKRPFENPDRFTVNERDLDPGKKLLSLEKVARVLAALGSRSALR